ncbi:MAG: hypothetical protein SFY92_07280 [Verrucomicrobiae bacterium]|nr:hypothetical protein [Verrucomicrobiae bacterium]
MWKRFEIPGIFSMNIPEESEPYSTENEGSLIIPLPTEPKTEIIMSIIPVSDPSGVTYELLENELRAFVEESIKPVADLTAMNFEPPVEIHSPDLYCSQAMLTLSNRNWWVVRAYAYEGTDRYLMVHWNGPKLLLMTVALKVLISIELFAPAPEV